MKTYFPFIRKMFVLSSMVACNSNVQRMQQSKIIRPKKDSSYNFEDISTCVNSLSCTEDLENLRLISTEWNRTVWRERGDDGLKRRFFHIPKNESILEKEREEYYKLFTDRISQAVEVGAKNINYNGDGKGLEEVINKIRSLKALKASIPLHRLEAPPSLRPIIMELGRQTELIHLELDAGDHAAVSESLRLFFNPIRDGEGTECLSQLPSSLIHLSIMDFCRIDKKGVEAIATLTNLKELRLEFVHGEVISLSNLKGLETLELGKYGGVSSEELQMLCSLSELKKLDIGFIWRNCQVCTNIHSPEIFTDKAIQCLENLKNLTSLCVNKKQFNERGRAILLELQKRKNLQIQWRE